MADGQNVQSECGFGFLFMVLSASLSTLVDEFMPKTKRSAVQKI